MLRLLSAASSCPKSENNPSSALKIFRIVFETTARHRQVKIRDNANKLSDHDHKNLTPCSSIGPDERISRLKQTQLEATQLEADEHDELPEATQFEAELHRQIDGLQSQVTELHKTREETNPELSSEFQSVKKKLNEHSKQLEQSAEKLSQLESENLTLRDEN